MTPSNAKKIFLMLMMFVTTLCTWAQSDRVITGTVTSADGEPLIGATVRTTKLHAVATDVDGKYSITVKGNPDLEFTYIGYETKRVKTAGKTHIDVVLDENTTILDEVVAVGYGVQPKKLLSGATSHIGSADIQKQNAVSPYSALQGMTPGVSITKNNGKPGEGFKVQIRGAGTMYDSAPLCIIDGQPGDLNALNPADIESIDVLKDAASAAIYGARAANGVILVTTKQAQRGQTRIFFDAYYGIQNIKNNSRSLGATEYLELLQETGLITEADITSANIPMLNRITDGTWNGTNWIEEMRRKNAPMQNYALNINKGNDNSAINIGLSYTSQKPTMAAPDEQVGSGYSRYTARINSDMTLFKHNGRDVVKVGETLTMTFTDKRGLDQATGHTTWNDFRNALKASPLFPAYDEDGNFGWPVRFNKEEFNPLAKMYYNSAQKQSRNYSATGNFYFLVSPVQGLDWRSSYGVRFSGWSYRGYVPAYDLNGSTEMNSQNKVTQQGGMGLGWTIENVVSYKFSLPEGHMLDAMVGNTVEKNGMGDNFSGSNSNVEFDDFFHAYLGNAKSIESGRTTLSGSAWGISTLVSVFGRVNYNYRNRYMATVTVRGDGSSNFAKGHRWGCFPSISAAYNLSEEEFMRGAKEAGFDYFKIRASWGESGNNKLDAFRYLGTMTLANSANAAYYYFGDKTNSPAIGSFIEYPSNPDLTWETSRQTDVGFDMAVLGHRLSVNFDWYHKKTMDWLVQTTALGIWGTTYGPWVNGGDIVNSGVEMQLGWNDRVGDFSYSVSGNFGYNRNKVTRIANDDNYIEGNENILGSGTGRFYRAEVGKPLGYFYGYRHGGIFQNQEEIDAYVDPRTGEKIMPSAKPGDVRFIDLDGDGKITSEDREMLGDPNPDFTFGVSLSLQYKAFDLYVNGTGVAGNQIVKSYRVNSVLNASNFTESDLGRWHGEGTSDFLPSLNGSSANWQYVSDLYVENGDYFRISNITFGVDFKKLFKRIPVQKLRLYFTGQNLFTFTKYSGMDPEVSAYTGAQSWARGIDLGNYPGAHSFIIGVNIQY